MNERLATMNTKISWTELIALLFIIIGTIWLVAGPYIFNAILTSILVLKPNSLAFNFWNDPPVTSTVSYYFFNWTNPEEIRSTSSKPKFEEIGPYTYTIQSNKFNLTWNENDTLTFRESMGYYFDEQLSRGKLTDQITTLDVIALTATRQIRHSNYLMKKGISLTFAALATEIHVTKSASELLYDGYENPFLDLARTFWDSKEPLPAKGGFVYGKNNSNTATGVFNMATGVDENTGDILNWNYRNETPIAKGSCAELRGTTGDFFQRRPRAHMDLFFEFTCRNVKLDYESDIVEKGIEGNKYSAQQSLLDNGTLVPENKCFCNDECLPSGILDISSCMFEAPLFMSLPHFYGADPIYLRAIEGLQPEKSKHELFIYVEPVIGFALQRTVRLQLNFLLQPIEYITPYEEVPKIFFPIMWFEQKTSISDDFASIIRIVLTIPSIIFPVSASSFIIIGGLLLLKNSRTRNKFFKFVLFKKECTDEEQIPLQKE